MTSFAYAAANNAAARHPSLVQIYTHNIAYAARLLWGAFLARSPKQVERQMSRRQKLRSIATLNEMAHEVEGSMPGLASELRMLAGRD